jgi:CTP:molybdopterin cytidylyltransferase MocA
MAVPGDVSTQVQVLVLAAGEGTRMGGAKALLCWEPDEPLAVTHVRRLERFCSVPSVVVTNRRVAELLPKGYPDLHVLVSREPPEHGPAGSVTAAVKTPGLLHRPWTALLHVDQVPVRPGVFAVLWNRVRPGVDGLRPVFRGKGGHPLLVRTQVLRRFFSSTTSLTMHDVMWNPSVRRVDVSTPFVEVRQDLDTPEVFEALRGRAPHFWFPSNPGK